MMTRRSLFDRFLRTAPLLVLPPAAGLLSGCASIGFSLPSFLGSDMASIAERYEGKTAKQLGFPADLWCADFANLVRKEAGFRSTLSRAAIQQTRFAKLIDRPVRGALMITMRGKEGYHVDIVLDVHWNGTLTVIGGNISDPETGVSAVRKRLVTTRGIFVIPTT